MTNYNESLDEITIDLWAKYGRPGTMDEFVPEAKQAITSLIKELVADAKPDNAYKTSYGLVPKGLEDSATAHDVAIKDFEQNLLKALEEV